MDKIAWELKRKARAVDLLEYLRKSGYRLEKTGKHEYCLADNHSLKISNNLWHDFAPDRKKGGSTLEFLTEYEGIPMEQAVETLTDLYQNSRSSDDNYGKIPYRCYKGRQRSEPKELFLPPKNKSFNKVYAYLIRTRKIHPKIISDMVKQGKIYESDRNNCIFLGTDKDGKVCYAAQRGTNPDKVFRKDCLGSDKRFGFSMEGRSQRLYLFESPIDTLSHSSIFRLRGKDYTRDHRLSLGGVEPIALLQYIEDRPGIKEVVLCLDNDRAGRAATGKILGLLSEKGYIVSDEPPVQKDYNADLIEMAKNMERKMSI